MSKPYSKRQSPTDLISQIMIGLTIALLTGLFFAASFDYEIKFLNYVGVPKTLASQLAELDMTVYLTLIGVTGVYVLLLLMLLHLEFDSARFRNLIRNKALRISLLVVGVVLLLAAIFLTNENSYLKIGATAASIGLFALICLAFPVAIDLARHFRNEKLSSIALLMVAFTISLWGLFPMMIDNFAKTRAASFKSDTVNIHSKEYELIRYYSSKILLKQGGYFLTISTDEAGLVEYKNSQ